MTCRFGLQRRRGDVLVPTGELYPTYVAASREGRTLYGYGNFHVTCPEGYVPTRNEQLGIEDHESRLSSFLSTL